MKFKRGVRTFIKALLLSLIMLFLITAGVFFAYQYLKKNNDNMNISGLNGNSAINSGLKSNNVFQSIIEPVPDRINFLLLGADKGESRADTIIIGSYLTTNGSASLVSMPRDTMVTMPKDRVQYLKSKKGATVPSDGVMKLNEVMHHSNKDGIDFTVKQIEEMLGIDLDYYIEVNLEGFRYFVDAVGGIEYDVPMRMYYNDPTQKLLIDLKPGLQTLDGKQAEGLVRFRYGYKRSDFDRMETQQNFIKVLSKQVLSSEKIVNNLPDIITAGFKYVKTNINLADITKYLKYFKDFSPDSINTYTLPTSSKKIGKKDYQILDEAGSKEIIEKVFMKHS